MLSALVVFALYDAENLGILSKRGVLSALLPGDDRACVDAAFATVRAPRLFFNHPPASTLLNAKPLRSRPAMAGNHPATVQLVTVCWAPPVSPHHLLRFRANY